MACHGFCGDNVEAISKADSKGEEICQSILQWSGSNAMHIISIFLCPFTSSNVPKSTLKCTFTFIHDNFHNFILNSHMEMNKIALEGLYCSISRQFDTPALPSGMGLLFSFSTPQKTLNKQLINILRRKICGYATVLPTLEQIS